MVLTKTVAALGAMAIALGSVGSFPGRSEGAPRDYSQEVAQYLIGILETEPAQNAAGETYQVRMTTCAVTPPEPSDRGIWLYQEQSLITTPDQPYRQRFLQLVPTPDNTVQSISFRPLTPAPWINLCDRPPTDRVLAPTALEDPHCTVTLTPLLTVYRGTTPPGGCPAKVRGAVTITNQIVLYSRGMDTWDRGYDAQGQQLWGARGQAYRFIRQTAIEDGILP